MALDPVLPLSNPASPIEVSAPQWRRLDVGSTMTHDGHALAAKAGVCSGLGATVSGLTVTVTPGVAIVTPTVTANGSYRVAAATNTTLTLAARHASLTRHDLIVLRVNDATVDASGLWGAVLEVVTGVASGAPADPEVPAGALVLARAVVPPSGTVTMVDRRTYTAALGGVIPCTSDLRPEGVQAGTIIYELDTKRLMLLAGTVWASMIPRIAGGSVVPAHLSPTVPSKVVTPVAFPVGAFTAAPVVVASLIGGGGSLTWTAPRPFDITKDGFKLWTDNCQGAVFHWIAFQ